MEQTRTAILDRTIDTETDTEFAKIFAKEWPNQVYFDEAGMQQERPAQKNYQLGNPELPVAKCREHGVEMVKNHLLTIVTARTATGKSTEFPQYLFESGYFSKIIVTQPRVVAARQLKRYVDSTIATSLNDPNHNLVGYRTAQEGDESEDNAISYVTDGLQLMHEISHNGITKDQVLVIDEYHERSENMDALLAIAVKYGMRVVVMSATLDAEKLSNHYSKIVGEQAPVIEIPGASYEVEERESTDLDRDVIEAARRHENVLVFLPGREQIQGALSKFGRKVPEGYTLLALHGDQTPNEQSKVFLSYPKGVIVFSTSVGQTSITIPGIDTVIDCGYERTATLSPDGVRTLAIQLSSRATAEQRRGRVGRVKKEPGQIDKYIRAQYRGFPLLPPLDEIAEYDIPAIQRVPMQDTILKLAAFGHRLDDLPFYDLPSEAEIDRANERLTRLKLFRKLGNTALEGYAITKLGEQAAHLPLDVNSARMVLKSRQYGPEVELQMLAAAVVQQLNGITSTAKGMDKWRHLTSETNSDIIAGVDYMVAAMQRNGLQQEKANIIELRYNKAFRAFESLANRRGLDVYDLKTPSDEQRIQLIESIITGTDELFVRNGLQAFTDNKKRKRVLVSSTIIDVLEGDVSLVAGHSFDMQRARSKKINTTKFVTTATQVTSEMLLSILPDRTTTVIDGFNIDEEGWAVTNERVFFDGNPTRQCISRRAEPSVAVQKFIVDQIFLNEKTTIKLPTNIAIARKLIFDFKRLQNRTVEDLGVDYSVDQIIAKTVREASYMIRSMEDIDPYIDLEAIREIVPEEIRDEILLHSPDVISVIDEKDGSLEFKIEYLANSDRAHVTIPARYYHLLPFVMGEHRLSVRPDSKTEYKTLEQARYDHTLPTRDQRRSQATIGAGVTRIAGHNNQTGRQVNKARPTQRPKTSSPRFELRHHR